MVDGPSPPGYSPANTMRNKERFSACVRAHTSTQMHKGACVFRVCLYVICKHTQNETCTLMLYVYVLVSGIRDSAYAYVCTVGASAHACLPQNIHLPQNILRMNPKSAHQCLRVHHRSTCEKRWMAEVKCCSDSGGECFLCIVHGLNFCM